MECQRHSNQRGYIRRGFDRCSVGRKRGVSCLRRPEAKVSVWDAFKSIGITLRGSLAERRRADRKATAELEAARQAKAALDTTTAAPIVKPARKRAPRKAAAVAA
jgi:hypothetical protein